MPDSMPEPMVDARDLTRRYGAGSGAVEALRGATLAVGRAELVAVHGRSGAGKTTLLNIVAGLDRPDSGRIAIAGQDLSALGEDALRTLRRESVGYVVQSFGLVPNLTAAENVGLPLRLQGTDPGVRDARVAELLERLGVAGCTAQLPDQLSGGQQQRVAIARALSSRPALLLADEPTGQLDTGTGRAVVALLRSVAVEEGIAVLVCTHDTDALAVADRVLELFDGRIREVP